jgi:hypothetical protein
LIWLRAQSYEAARGLLMVWHEQDRPTSSVDKVVPSKKASHLKNIRSHAVPYDGNSKARFTARVLIYDGGKA